MFIHKALKDETHETQKSGGKKCEEKKKQRPDKSVRDLKTKY